jgi:hypothetical protein
MGRENSEFVLRLNPFYSTNSTIGGLVFVKPNKRRYVGALVNLFAFSSSEPSNGEKFNRTDLMSGAPQTTFILLPSGTGV